MSNFDDILERSKFQSQELENQTMLQPFAYIGDVLGEKRECYELLKVFNYWLKIPDDKFLAIREILEIIHNSTLLIDDVEDNSIFRKGKPVTHSLFSVANCINSANYVLFVALEKVLLLNHPEVIKVYMDLVIELHRGQGMDIYWRDNFVCPEESEYKIMIIRKTGGLFKFFISLMQLFSDNKKDFTKMAALLAMFCQIFDDYCNLKKEPDDKNFCEDITEGTFSFPIIHAIQAQKGSSQVLHILRQRTRVIGYSAGDFD